MDDDDIRVMRIALAEAEQSLRDGDHGFGAAIVKNGEIVALAHDTDTTDRDPTAHAEMTAIRTAAARFGGNLDGCRIVSTHEPCPMCATAILWAGIDTVVYGVSIADSLRQGRRRIDLPCREIFARAGLTIMVREGVLREECAILYDRDVRDQIEFLRSADETALRERAEEVARKRVDWFRSNTQYGSAPATDPLDAAYEVFLRKLGLTPDDAPVMDRGETHLTMASRNFCPTLEACRILGLDTRFVCRHLTEKPTETLLRLIDPRLRFTRNYTTLRPRGAWCEETISLES